MNARQRRKLRRWAQRKVANMKWGKREVDMPLALLLRASTKHFVAVTRAPYCWPGGRREKHLRKVLKGHKFVKVQNGRYS